MSLRLSPTLRPPRRLRLQSPMQSFVHLLVLLLLALRVDSSEDNKCDFSLSDSSKEGKVVHTFQTSCREGEVLWRFPWGGLELTFKKPPRQPAARMFLPHGSDADDDDDLQFCYVIVMTTVNITLLREMPGRTFVPGELESCISARSLTSEWLKFYIESTPSLLSTLVGRFELLYVWSRPTPFDLCRHCSPRELEKAVCSSRNIFTGRIGSPKRSRTAAITLHVTNVMRFDRSDAPKHFCLRRKRRRAGAVSPTTTKPASSKSFFDHHKCDTIVANDGGRCFEENSPFKKHIEEEFIFIANTSLKKFRTTCAMPLKRFWKSWKTMEARDETDCLFPDHAIPQPSPDIFSK